MGIDRIGNGVASGRIPASQALPPGQDRAPSAVARSADSAPSTSAPAPVETSAGSALPQLRSGQITLDTSAGSALQQLRSGQITLDVYLDAKVDEATARLSLPRAELEPIRASLRDRLASDPTLVELVRCATGAAPSNEG